MAAPLVKYIRAALAGVLLLTAASAGQARPDARTLACSAIQALLNQEGSVVFSTGQNTYDRYVSGQAACSGTEVARARSVAASDTNQCQVFRCESRLRGPRR